MLESIALIFLFGLAGGRAASALRLPRLLGMLLAGMLIGPCGLALLGEPMLALSGDLRKLALIIILARAGLSLNLEDLKKVGRPAMLMCFVPACFEIAGMLLLAPRILGISLADAAVMGAVVAAVSPAVVVPQMLRLMDEGWGTREGIPQLILAGASVDDVFVIVLFSAFTSLAAGKDVGAAHFLQIPVSIVLGVVLGIAAGYLLGRLLRRTGMRPQAEVLLLLSVSILLAWAEQPASVLGVPFSGLLAVMSCGLAAAGTAPAAARRLSEAYGSLWAAAEIVLFVLVGAAVELGSAAEAGLPAAALILLVLVFRAAGVLACLLGTRLKAGERLFCVIAYLPKATVQAAIGAVPLAMGLGCGSIVLTVSVLSILISAPIGAVGMSLSYKKLLEKA